MSHPTDASISDQLSRHLETQLALCDGLEKIADSLPNNYCRQECLKIAAQIYATVKSAHQFEEQTLFPLVQSSYPSGDLGQTIEQLHSDHWEDESYAFELQDALYGLVTTPQRTNKEALGYMLRGFFGNLRRHIAFEREYFADKLEKLDTKEAHQNG